jgi:hypothetical protein
LQESRVQLLQGQLENAKAEIASAKKEICTVALLKSQGKYSAVCCLGRKSLIILTESTRVSQLEVELNRTAVERDNLIKELQRYRDNELLINEVLCLLLRLQ